MAAALELEQSRRLITALEDERRVLADRLETERRATTVLNEINETRKSENTALTATVRAKDETIAARDTVIAAQQKQIESRRPSLLRRVGDILAGVAIGRILK